MTNLVSLYSFEDQQMQQFSDEVRTVVNSKTTGRLVTGVPIFTEEYIVDNKRTPIYTRLYKVSGDASQFPLGFNVFDVQIFQINAIAQGNGNAFVFPHDGDSIVLNSSMGIITFSQQQRSAYDIFVTIKYGV